jgi:ABC-type transport system involved in multi-copper enzyme maturation permease subunit
MIVIHMVAEELRRLLSRRRFWILAATLAAILVYIISLNTTRVHPGSAPADFMVALMANLPWELPLITGLAVGDSFAIDRHTSWATFVLTRGLTRRRYIVAKGIGMAIAICLLLTMSLAVAAVAAAHMKGLAPTISTSEFANINPADHASYLAHPWWFAAQFAGVNLLAAAAYSTTALLLAVWVPIPFVVSIVPALAIFVAMVTIPESAQQWNPSRILALERGTMSGRFMYFLIWLLVAATVAIIAYGKQEDA